MKTALAILESVRQMKNVGEAWRLVAKAKEANYVKLEAFARAVEPYVADAACSGLIPKKLYDDCVRIKPVIYGGARHHHLGICDVCGEEIDDRQRK